MYIPYQILELHKTYIPAKYIHTYINTYLNKGIAKCSWEGGGGGQEYGDSHIFTVSPTHTYLPVLPRLRGAPVRQALCAGLCQGVQSLEVGVLGVDDLEGGVVLGGFLALAHHAQELRALGKRLSIVFQVVFCC